MNYLISKREAKEVKRLRSRERCGGRKSIQQVRLMRRMRRYGVGYVFSAQDIAVGILAGKAVAVLIQLDEDVFAGKILMRGRAFTGRQENRIVFFGPGEFASFHKFPI